MKKIILKSSIFIAILGITLWSCSKDEIINQKSPIVNNAELFENLTDYNRRFIDSKQNYNRGFWSSLGYVCQVASADLIGAGTCIWATGEIIAAAGVTTGGTGAVIATVAAGAVGAAGGSYAASGNAPTGNGGNYVDNSNLQLQLPPCYSVVNSTGSLHNSYLKSVIFDNTSQSTWLNTNFPSDATKLSNFLMNQEIVDLYNYINIESLSYKNSGYDYYVLINNYESMNYISSNIAQVLTTFMDAYSQSENIQDVNDIVSFYTAQILNSNLIESEKRALFGSFSVALKSPYFWNS